MPSTADTDRLRARMFREDLGQWATGGVYANFLTADEGQERVRAAYGLAKYERLAALKAKYDPGNVFHANMNIQPAQAGTRAPLKPF